MIILHFRSNSWAASIMLWLMWSLYSNLTGASSSWLLSSGQSYWTHAYDWSGISDIHFSNTARFSLLINCPTIYYEIQGEKDDKIIAVCADDPEYRHYNDIKDLPPHRLAEIRRFFEDCILLKVSNFVVWSIHFICLHLQLWQAYV